MPYTHNNLITLDQLQLGVHTNFSESIYFKNYAYRVSLHTPIGGDREVKRFHIRALEMDLKKILELCVGAYRVKLNRGYPHALTFIYLQSCDDLRMIVNSLKDIVTKVSGPMNQEHLQILQSNTYSLKLRNQRWYNTYDCKVKCHFFSWRYPYNSAERAKEFYDFFNDNIPIKSINQKKNVRTSRTEFCCNYEDFEKLQPFMKLAFPKERVLVERCIVSDK